MLNSEKEFEVWWNETEGAYPSWGNEYFYDLKKKIARKAWFAAKGEK